MAVIAGPQAPLTAWYQVHFPEAAVALLGACLLFVLPVNWSRREYTLTIG